METALDTIAKTLPAGAPEWIQLVPAGTFKGEDGRGPYVVENAETLIAASMSSGRKLPIDENHAIDLRRGESTQARGWIVAMEARNDGIWGKVEWTPTGKQLVEDRSYGFISPVFSHPLMDPPYRVAAIHRASLVNDPNLDLKSLHSKQKGTGVLEELRKELGLSETATEAEVLAAVKTSHGAQTAMATIAVAAGAAKDAKVEDVVKAINAKAGVAEALGPIAEAAGVAKDAKPDDIVKAINARGAGAGGTESEEVKTLKGEVKTLHTKLTQVETAAAKERATTAIDTAIKDGKIVPAMRDRFITRHMKEPQDVEEEIKLLPSLHAGGLKHYKPTQTGDGQLDADEMKVAEMMGIDPKEFAATRKLERGA